MGSQSKYKSKDLVYVNIKIPDPEGGDGAVGLKYGFFTNIPAGNRSDLGQVAIPPTDYADPPTALIIGASFPKPRRASRRETQRFTSSFVGVDKIASAKVAGYRIGKTKARSKLKVAGSGSYFVETVYVTIRGIKYGWNIPKVSKAHIGGDAAALGIRNAAASDRDELCFGANFPKPPRANKSATVSNEVQTYSTFYDPSTESLPSGWQPSGGGVYSIL
ncbi:hypothetical protein [Gloeocapsopsis sp. IPPAS B-1203]|uniref:hypothetical protein n=1 Tax=Gloeocapsopsis sp. IPPAS B-1203 TaxID=2049454 RepID=UPI000C1A4F3B|nr:hypothetical protein [Gloeocapsopsis sp. IPPAS B-1203]PIG90820.1 hypothetical protein CSQ79_24545 [Gloeocapsopsis sp. IPPAS B-1203]